MSTARAFEAGRRRLRIGLAAGLSSTILAALAFAPSALALNTSGALVSSADCTANVLPRNDDSFTSAIALPFAVDFYGVHHDQFWVNNNGNITFDGPLSTYTPFGLQATSHAIIAPFFADVDTRASGSQPVRYGWGQTTFQGRPAVCVDWVDVGYYNQRADKLNSIQLLLVDRSDVAAGDFDIVFDYGSITWETGDASGGSGGLGGDSARVGFSNGDGTNANSYELPGSGIDGSLLDASSRGLIHRTIGPSNQLGRYGFEIRNGQPAPARYAALGDSYSSGLGAGGYGDTDGNCYRSENAYAHLLINDGTVPFGAASLDFVACAGAKINDLYTGMKGEPSQLDVLGPQTALATVGVGGNDLGFAPLLKACLEDQYTVNSSSCAEHQDEQVFERLMAINGHTAAEPLNKLQQLYDVIRTKAWRAKLVVPGYPRFFPIDGGTGLISSILGGSGTQRCEGLRVSDQLWINEKIRQLDTAIAASARSMGGEYAAMYDAFGGHELCHSLNPLTGNWLHGVRAPIIANVDESFHPTADGQKVYADKIRDALQGGPGSDPFLVHQDETTTGSTDVSGGLFGFTWMLSWPGSTVETTLVSPSGRVVDATHLGSDVHHRVTPTSELFYVRDPEPGRWTVKMFGADVREGGEPTTLGTYDQPRPNEPPVARMTITKTAKDAIVADAGASTDADGQVVDYLWDFGDGTYAAGRRAEHVFAAPGTYRVTLTAQDDDLALGFATQETAFVITPYTFSGFKSPVDNPPTVNTVNAGRAIPVKFTLGGASGLGIFDPGYPKVQRLDCATGAPSDEIEETVTAGASELTYDGSGGSYHYVWKTDKAWAGSCRRLVLGFNDATQRFADFKMR